MPLVSLFFACVSSAASGRFLPMVGVHGVQWAGMDLAKSPLISLLVLWFTCGLWWKSSTPPWILLEEGRLERALTFDGQPTPRHRPRSFLMVVMPYWRHFIFSRVCLLCWPPARAGCGAETSASSQVVESLAALYLLPCWTWRNGEGTHFNLSFLLGSLL
jgi:hypothetical protein